MKAYMETYGCSANRADSEIMEALLERAGIGLTGSPKSADVIIINTCAVKSRTELHMAKLIRKYAKRRLIVAGCLSQARRKLVKQLAPNALLLSPANIGAVADIALGKRKGALGLKSTDKSLLPQNRGGLTARLPICEGCLGSCSYCITRLARGKLRSFSKERIAANAASAVAGGAKELWLTSQDCAVYGLERGSSLAELIDAVASVPGDFMIRIGMANPSFFLKNLGANLRAFANPKIFRFFHIPVQSGSDNVLKHMRRGYRAKDFERLVRGIRKKFPNAYISTDVIVGYPTETDADWKKTIALIKKTKPEIVNISRYSPRPGTPAAELKQIISRDVKRRSRELTLLHRKITLDANKRWLGKTVEAFVDERTPKGLMGRTRDYRPVALRSGSLGVWRRVKISLATPSYLGE